MKIAFHLEVISLGMLIAQGMFAALLLLFTQNNRKANRFLAMLVAMFSLWLCDTFFRVSGIYAEDPNYYFLPIYFSLAFGPLIYFYTRALTEQDFAFRPQDLIHFVLVLLQFVFYLVLQLKGYEFRRSFWFDVHRPYTYDLEFGLSLLSLLVYLALSLSTVKRYQHWIHNHFSNLSQLTLRWLLLTHGFLWLLALLWLLDAAFRLFINYYPETPLSAISMGGTVLFLAIGGLLQKDLREVGTVGTESQAAEQVAASSAEEEIEEALLRKIEAGMKEDQLFLRNELSLKEFATEVDAPSRKVSTHINLGLGVSFIDFVNRYRVDKVKELIESGTADHLSLFGIALESGFNSKPTFNRVFRKFTGKSPSEYQKEVQNRN